MRRLAATALLASSFILAGCQMRVPFSTAPDRGEQTQLEQLAGTIFYRQRIALPDDAVAVIRLMERDGGEIAVRRTASQGRQVPLPFTVDYDPARIVGGQRYVLHAEILDGAGKPIWRQAEPFPLSFAGEPIAILLIPAG